jgi:N-acylneuraminate cytidylyltransferase
MCTIKTTSYSNLKNNINSFMINRLLIIPARGNSKRIHNKNIRLFHKKPIIYYVLDLAKKSKLFKKIHVSTESNKVAKVVNNLGLKIDFMRPKFLSKDTTPVVDVLNYVYKKYDPKETYYDEVWTMFPCSPLLLKKDLIKASKISKIKKKKILLAITKFGAPIQWAFKKDKNNNLKPLFKKKLFLRSQSLKTCFYDAGAFAVFPAKFFSKKIKNFEDKFLGFELPQERAVDIDDLDNWKFAEYLYKVNKK